MSYNDREAVAKMDYNMEDVQVTDGKNTHQGIFDTLPPGEEGFDISHSGGEHEVFSGLGQEMDNLLRM